MQVRAWTRIVAISGLQEDLYEISELLSANIVFQCLEHKLFLFNYYFKSVEDVY